MHSLSRRQFAHLAALSTATIATPCALVSAAAAAWQPRYIVGSSMYGSIYVGDVMAEVRKTGATAIDIWPRPHGNQREQLTDMGEATFRALLAKHEISLGCITQYKLGPFGLKDEMPLASRFGCKTIVTGGEGPIGLTGADLRKAVQAFVEKMKPHLEVAEANSVTIAIENHAKNLIDSADSLRYLAELRPSKHLAIALAPYHLPQDADSLGALIRELGPAIEMFYAWEHGEGCMSKQPKEKELLQMPGRGPLDFGPLIQALVDINYQGWTEIFMHPFPRGISILETAAEVTAEINRARDYLAKLPAR